MAFAFCKSSVPAAHADGASGSRSAQSKSPSQWNHGSVEAGLRRRLPLFGELSHAALMLWLITQLQECGRRISVS